MFCGYLKTFLQESTSHLIDLLWKFFSKPRHHAKNYEHTTSFNQHNKSPGQILSSPPPFNLHNSQRQVLLLSSFKKQKTKTRSDYIILPQLIISGAWVWTEAAYSRALAVLLSKDLQSTWGRQWRRRWLLLLLWRGRKKRGGRGRSSTTCSQAI